MHKTGYKAFPSSQCAPEHLPICLNAEEGEKNLSYELCAKEIAGFSVRQTGKRDTIREKRGREASNLQGSFTDSACLGQLAPCVPGICLGFSIDPQALSARISFNTKPTKVNPEF